MPRELPSIPDVIPQVRAPHPSVSPGQIAQPYLELANVLDKRGQALEKIGDVLMEDVAKPAAEKAGLQAVTRDADGNLQVDKVPIFGAAADTYKRAVQVGALAELEGDARRKDITLREQFRDQPQGYLKAADEYKQGMVRDISGRVSPEVGVALGRVIDSQTTQTYKGLLNESERLALARAEKSINAGIQSARDDAVALARGGAGPDDPAMQQAFGKIEALTQEKVKNPRLAYPPEQAAFDIQHLQGELAANRFLFGIEKTYQDKGAEAALEEAKGILTNPSNKLTEEQRYAYFHKATAEIRANEALRRQDLGLARKASQDAMYAAARGVAIEPELQSQIMDQLKQAGGQADAARFAAAMTRATQLDSFNKLPLSQQTAQLGTFQTAASAKSAYQFFTDKGYTPAQAAGIVGNLIQESGVNPGSVGDGGISFGIAQWNRERLQALAAFAKARGTSPADFNTQLEFVHHELQTSEAGAGAALRAAGTPEAAARAFIGFERPSGYTPENPEAGHGFVNRVRNAQQVYANATGAPVDQRVQFGAGVDLRLAAGMQRSVDTKAKATWEKLSKDMDGGQAPNADDLNSVIDGFRLTNDHDMLEKVAARVDRFEAARQSGLTTLPNQQALIGEFERRAALGQLSPGDDAWRKDLITRNRAITEGLQNNPITTTLQSFPDRFKAPGPLDFGNDQALTLGLRQRGLMAQFASQNWQVPPVSALDKADVAQVQAVLESPDPAVKARIFGAMTAALPEDVRNATLAKIGEKGPQAMVAAAAGGLMREAPDIAQSILRGQAAIKADKGYIPDKKDKTAFDEDLTKMLPPATFTLAGRTYPTGPFAIARDAIEARYADLSAQANDSTGRHNKDRLQQAVTDVTGGVLTHNSGTLIAPVRSMTQRQFDGVLWGLNDSDLAGVTTLAGEPVTAAYLRNNARLESVGDGRYLVKLGSDDTRPIYAYRGANTEMPDKFMLDLRGRKQGPVPFIDPNTLTPATP